MERKEACQMAQASMPSGNPQEAAPDRRKGRFYLFLASVWPTVAGRRRWARKGVERRLEAFEAQSEENLI